MWKVEGREDDNENPTYSKYFKSSESSKTVQRSIRRSLAERSKYLHRKLAIACQYATMYSLKGERGETDMGKQQVKEYHKNGKNEKYHDGKQVIQKRAKKFQWKEIDE